MHRCVCLCIKFIKILQFLHWMRLQCCCLCVIEFFDREQQVKKRKYWTFSHALFIDDVMFFFFSAFCLFVASGIRVSMHLFSVHSRVHFYWMMHCRNPDVIFVHENETCKIDFRWNFAIRIHWNDKMTFFRFAKRCVTLLCQKRENSFIFRCIFLVVIDTFSIFRFNVVDEFRCCHRSNKFTADCSSVRFFSVQAIQNACVWHCR